MANTNWFVGIDEGLSTPGGTQTALAGYYFVDAVNGDDGTGDGSPDNPWQTLTFSINQLTGGTGETGTGYDLLYNARLVMADGDYDVTSAPISKSDISLIANVSKQVTINCNGTYHFVNLIAISADGIIFYQTAYGRRNVVARDCIFYDSGIFRQNQGGKSYAQRCVFIKSASPTYDAVDNVAAAGDNAKQYIDRCTFVNNPVLVFGKSGNNNKATYIEITNTDIKNVGDIEISDAFISNNTEYNISNCNYDESVDLLNVTDSSSVAVSSLDGTRSNNSVIADDYAGTLDDLELILNNTSGLIGAGENDTTIGALRIGELVDLSSPAENNDITVGSDIVITNPATTGNIKPALKTLDQIRKSPIVKINGLPDNTDDVPDNETTLIDPKRKTVNILWRETVGGSDNTGEFLYNAPMYVDDSGNYTGEDDFDPFDISSDGDIVGNPDNLTSANLIDVAQVQPNFVLNDQ